MHMRIDLFIGKKLQNQVKNQGKLTSWPLKAGSISGKKEKKRLSNIFSGIIKGHINKKIIFL